MTKRCWVCVTHRSSALNHLIYLLFICAALNSKSLVFLTYKPFIFLGNISYGFYLIHYPIIMYLVNEFNWTTGVNGSIPQDIHLQLLTPKG
jgi:peptidoglycan/LPS O-acetylase OafA/YrhL